MRCAYASAAKPPTLHVLQIDLSASTAAIAYAESLLRAASRQQLRWGPLAPLASAVTSSDLAEVRTARESCGRSSCRWFRECGRALGLNPRVPTRAGTIRPNSRSDLLPWRHSRRGGRAARLVSFRNGRSDRATVDDPATSSDLRAGFSCRDLSCPTGDSRLIVVVHGTSVEAARLLRAGHSAAKPCRCSGRAARKELDEAGHLRNDDSYRDARADRRSLGPGYVQRSLAINKRRENMDVRMEAKRLSCR